MFIARQPIFTDSMVVYGYELLYRDNKKATSFGNVSAKKATAQVLGGLFELGIENITDGKKAFVNFDYDFLLTDSIELIDSDKLIIEVLEGVKADNLIIDRLIDLKEKGYKIALDDFQRNSDNLELVHISNIIKYDIIATPLETIAFEVQNEIKQGKTVIAEKIETIEEYQKAKDIGFHLFQGYFFEKPNIIVESNNKKSIKLNYLKILTELNNPEPSYTKVSKIIESDLNLAYRLLRIIKNNRSEETFDSIRRALVYMEFKDIERWINILMLQDLSVDKPLELMRVSLIRSKFGGSLANHSIFKKKFNEISMMLLFSTLDAMLDLPMEEALEGISLTDEIKQPLITKHGKLSPILQLVFAYEKGYWAEVQMLLVKLGIKEEELYKDYLDALTYSKNIINMF